MRCSRAAATSPSMSFGCTGRFVPKRAVPAFPGAMNSSSTFALWRSFHAIACSRPPMPTISTRLPTAPASESQIANRES